MTPSTVAERRADLGRSIAAARAAIRRAREELKALEGRPPTADSGHLRGCAGPHQGPTWCRDAHGRTLTGR